MSHAGPTSVSKEHELRSEFAPRGLCVPLPTFLRTLGATHSAATSLACPVSASVAGYRRIANRINHTNNARIEIQIDHSMIAKEFVPYGPNSFVIMEITTSAGVCGTWGSHVAYGAKSQPTRPHQPPASLAVAAGAASP